MAQPPTVPSLLYSPRAGPSGACHPNHSRRIPMDLSFEWNGRTLRVYSDGGDFMVRIPMESNDLDNLREAIGGSNTDLSDLQSAVEELRSKLEDTQSSISSALDDAERHLSDASDEVENAKSAIDCHSDAAEALAEVERQMENLDS